MKTKADLIRISRAFELLKSAIEAGEAHLLQTCPIEVSYNGLYWSPKNKRIWHEAKDRPLSELPLTERLVAAKSIPSFLDRADTNTEEFCRAVEDLLGPKDLPKEDA